MIGPNDRDYWKVRFINSSARDEMDAAWGQAYVVLFLIFVLPCLGSWISGFLRYVNNVYWGP